VSKNENLKGKIQHGNNCLYCRVGFSDFHLDGAETVRPLSAATSSKPVYN
jgi:hypothetical protein